MDSRRFDELTRTLGHSTTRRSFLGAAGIAFTGIAFSRSAQRTSAQGCVDSSECPAGQICVNGFCFFPECLPHGSTCSSHDDCCDILLCLSGICSTSPTCGLQGAGCGGNGDCCPGLICAAGTCAPEPPAPPAPSQGGGGGGGGGTTPPPGSNPGGAASGTGTTASGVTVFALPETGSGAVEGSNSHWMLSGGIIAATGLLLKSKSLRRRISDLQSAHSDLEG
jgi:hypothetical protein